MKKYLIFVMLLICTGCSVTKNKIPNNIQRDNDEKKLIENEKIESIINTKEIVIENVLEHNTSVENDENKIEIQIPVYKEAKDLDKFKIEKILDTLKTAYRVKETDKIPTVGLHYKISFKNENNEILNELLVYTPTEGDNLIMFTSENSMYFVKKEIKE